MSNKKDKVVIPQTSLSVPIAGINDKVESVDLAVILTNNCNAVCSHCYNESGPNKSVELPFEKLKILINSGLVHQKPIKRIGFSGGEPLLYDGLEELVKLSCSKKIEVSCITGGVGISHDKFKQLALAGCDQLTISFDEYHEKFISRKKIVSLANFCTEHFPKVILQITSTSEDKGRTLADFFVDEARDIFQVRVMPVESVGRAKSFSQKSSKPAIKSEDSCSKKSPIVINFNEEVYKYCDVGGFVPENVIGFLDDLLVCDN